MFRHLVPEHTGNAIKSDIALQILQTMSEPKTLAEIISEIMRKLLKAFCVPLIRIGGEINHHRVESQLLAPLEALVHPETGPVLVPFEFRELVETDVL